MKVVYKEKPMETVTETETGMVFSRPNMGGQKLLFRGYEPNLSEVYGVTQQEIDTLELDSRWVRK